METPREYNKPLGDFRSEQGALGQMRSTPPPLTGGGGRTEGEGRPLPEGIFPDYIPKGYCQLVAQGLDSYQEAINLKAPGGLAEQFDTWQGMAKALDPRKGQAVTVNLGAESLQVWPCGSKGGVRWVFEGPDFLLMWRNLEHDWCLSVRYLSVGLWRHGLSVLRQSVYTMLEQMGCIINKDDGNRVSRADWAFDFYSPRFSRDNSVDMFKHIVMHSSVKKFLAGGSGDKFETITIGVRSTSLQIQVYDKTREINEVSGKGWMYDLWLANGWEPEDGEIKDVWRLEVRMGGDYLKERQANTPDSFNEHIEELVTEALVSHRLTTPSETDSNRRRWPLHPLWAIAYQQVGAECMRPLGHYVSGARNAITDRLKRQLAGTMRSVAVLNTGDWKDDDVRKFAEDAMQMMRADEDGERKAEAARERYKHVEDAR